MTRKAFQIDPGTFIGARNRTMPPELADDQLLFPHAIAATVPNSDAA